MTRQKAVTQAQENRSYYDGLARYGPYSVILNEKAGAMNLYADAVFNAALLPLLERDPDPIRLLDFGCGGGLFTLKARPYVKQVVGTDISSGLLRLARESAAQRRASVPFVQADGLKLPFCRGAVNRVVIREVLLHFADETIGQALEELARVIEPGGKCYLLEQVSESPKWQVWRREPGLPPLKKRGIDEIVHRFKDAGFDLERAVTVRQPRFPFVFLFWLRILPATLIPVFAQLEVAWNRHFRSLRSRRWQNVLFVFRRALGGDAAVV